MAEVGRLLGVHDEHFTGTAPTGREEDFHGVHLVFEAAVAAGEPAVVDGGGTTDAAAWVREGARAVGGDRGVRGRHRRARDGARRLGLVP